MNRISIFLLGLLLSSAGLAEINWNDGKIKWYDYEEGIKAAETQKKNVFLVVYADWCGVCKKYSKMFYNDEVIKQSENVILIRLNQDTDTDKIKQSKLVGEYVPRSYILNSDFEIQTSPYRTKKFDYYLSPGKDDYLADMFEWLRYQFKNPLLDFKTE